MAKPRASASPVREATGPPKTLSKAVQRRAVAVSEKLAARGLGAFVWHKKLDRDLSRGLLPSIVSLRSERRRCLARRKEAAGVKASAVSRRASPPAAVPSASLARAGEEAAKEAAFLLKQSRLRAGIRFAEGRPKRIDMLVGSLDGKRRCALAAFRGASAEELTELRGEIRTQADLDKTNGPFWEAAKVMCDAEIEKAAGTVGHTETLLHSKVAADVKSVVEGKNLEELDAMQQAIAARMAAGEVKIVEHWQEVTELIRVEKAKQLLGQNYSARDNAPAPPSFGDKTDTEREREDCLADADEEGSEPLLSVELPATQTSPAGPEWRKPKYVARVRTGYEWNRYNRVHYDHDHPPPKIVRGYKFVLHYPDLAGANPPQLTVEEDGGSDETCIIRFHAGWPYEDVAFKIVNKDWERSRKAGFRCTFQRGVLHLNFNFKRFFYRR